MDDNMPSTLDIPTSGRYPDYSGVSSMSVSYIQLNAQVLELMTVRSPCYENRPPLRSSSG